MALVNQRWFGYSGTSKTGKLHCYYGCKGAFQHRCNRKGIKKDYIEDFVIKQAKKILTSNKIEEIAKAVYSRAKSEKNNTRLKQLQQKLKENEKHKMNLFDSLKECNITNVRQSIFEEIAKMEKEKQAIEHQLAVEKASSYQVTIPQIKFFLRNLAKGNLDDIKYKQILINVLVYKVFVYDNNITIVFKTQDRYYEERVPTINQLESSFIGNSFPPLFFY